MWGQGLTEGMRNQYEVEYAIERAADVVLQWQRDDGSWRGKNRAGPMYVAATIACEAALGTIRPDDRALAEQTLRAAQRPDGGIEPWPSAGKSNAEATLYYCAGLRAVGVSEHDSAMQAAKARVAELGGTRAAGPMAATVAALVGTISPAELPPATSALALIPGHDELVSRLLGVNALLPLRTLPFLWETLRAMGTTARATLHTTGLRSLVAPRIERYLRERQNPSGGIAGVPLFTLLGLQCLQFCGVAKEEWLRKTWPCVAVWNMSVEFITRPHTVSKLSHSRALIGTRRIWFES
jgi:hypothetical protein